MGSVAHLICIKPYLTLHHRAQRRRRLRHSRSPSKPRNCSEARGASVNRLFSLILRDAHKYSSATGTGLFTTGIVGFVFAPLDSLTPEAGAIHEKIKQALEQLDPSTAPPGLIEQYSLLLERFKPGEGAPGCEFVSFPGMLSRPSQPFRVDKEDHSDCYLCIQIPQLMANGTSVSWQQRTTLSLEERLSVAFTLWQDEISASLVRSILCPTIPRRTQSSIHDTLRTALVSSMQYLHRRV